MNLIGKTSKGATPFALPADFRIGATFPMPAAGLIPRVSAWIDGQGSGVGDQPIRAVLYDAADVKLAESDEVVIAEGAAAAFVDFLFSGLPECSVEVPQDDLTLALHCGTAALSARIFTDPPNDARSKADTYSDGAAATFGGGTTARPVPTIYAPFFEVWVPPAEEEDAFFASLPFRQSQQVFGDSRSSGEPMHVTCGWHGTLLDVHEPAYAIVTTDGPLADLVGERLLVTTRGLRRAVYVYCHNEYTFDDRDLSLSRRAFMELAEPGLGEIAVSVEVVV